MSFNGDIELQGLDAAAHQLKMLGKGADKSGSSASMQLMAHLEPGDTAAASVLVGVATIVVSGKLAQFGSRLLVPVSDAMLAQFADNFRAAAAAVPAAAPSAAPAATPASSAAPESAPESAPAPATASAPATAFASPPVPAASGTEPASASPAVSTGPTAAPPAQEPTAGPDRAATPPPPAPRAPTPPLPPAPVKELNALSLMWTVFKGWLAGLFGGKKG